MADSEAGLSLNSPSKSVSQTNAHLCIFSFFRLSHIWKYRSVIGSIWNLGEGVADDRSYTHPRASWFTLIIPYI